MKNLFIAVFAAILLAACAGPGEMKREMVTMPGGEKATLVMHDQKAPDWMLKQDTMELNYIVKGDISEKQLAAVAEAERACRIFAKNVRPHNLVAVASQGVLYTAAGAIGVGLGSQAFAGAKFSEYARYGGLATGFAGLANGAVTLGGQTYTFENCGREIFDIFPGYEVRVLQKSPY